VEEERASNDRRGATPHRRSRKEGIVSYFRLRSFGDTEIETLARTFAAAQPFPHVVIPDMIAAPPADVLSNFPPYDSPCWKHFPDAYQRGKMILSNIALIREPLASMVRELTDPAGLEFVERVTGVRGLFPDPYLQGAGLQCSGPGGVMAPHTDTYIQNRLGVYRRVNLLVYLNPEWDETDGGCLEFYHRSALAKPAKTIVPRWGTMVLFASDAHSVHGFATPVRRGRIRRALAVYYYSAVPAPVFSVYPLTYWWRHDPYRRGEAGTLLVRLARLQIYRALRFGAKLLAYLAHRTEPRVSS